MHRLITFNHTVDYGYTWCKSCTCTVYTKYKESAARRFTWHTATDFPKLLTKVNHSNLEFAPQIEAMPDQALLEPNQHIPPLNRCLPTSMRTMKPARTSKHIYTPVPMQNLSLLLPIRPAPSAHYFEMFQTYSVATSLRELHRSHCRLWKSKVKTQTVTRCCRFWANTLVLACTSCYCTCVYIIMCCSSTGCILPITPCIFSQLRSQQACLNHPGTEIEFFLSLGELFLRSWFPTIRNIFPGLICCVRPRLNTLIL